MMPEKSLGFAVIGSGRIGTLRANMASRHPVLKFLAVPDRERHRAGILAQQTGTDFITDDNFEAIVHDAVFVATPEHNPAEAGLQAIDLGKSAFIEKPIALKLDDADRIIAAPEAKTVEIAIGYSRRHDRRWVMTNEQIVQGWLGRSLAFNCGSTTLARRCCRF